jgi:hypothetical protein
MSAGVHSQYVPLGAAGSACLISQHEAAAVAMEDPSTCMADWLVGLAELAGSGLRSRARSSAVRAPSPPRGRPGNADADWDDMAKW